MFSIEQIVAAIQAEKVIAYPTEAVFGLGCDPRSERAVYELLKLKKRPINKGLILISPNIELLLPYIDREALSNEEWLRLLQPQSSPTTWVVPTPQTTPRYLRGDFDTIAVRICLHPIVKQLCDQAGCPLTSTSANLSGEEAATTAQQVIEQFGESFPVLNETVGGATSPSTIKVLKSGQVLR